MFKCIDLTSFFLFFPWMSEFVSITIYIYIWKKVSTFFLAMFLLDIKTINTIVHTQTYTHTQTHTQTCTPTHLLTYLLSGFSRGGVTHVMTGWRFKAVAPSGATEKLKPAQSHCQTATEAEIHRHLLHLLSPPSPPQCGETHPSYPHAVVSNSSWVYLLFFLLTRQRRDIPLFSGEFTLMLFVCV